MRRGHINRWGCQRCRARRGRDLPIGSRDRGDVLVAVPARGRDDETAHLDRERHLGYITAAEKYDYAAIPVFMLAKDGLLIGDDPSRLTFETLGPFTDSVTRKPVANTTRYTYGTDDERYVVTFTRHRALARNRMIESLHGVKRATAELVRFDGAYLRFAGEIRVEHYQGGQIVDQSVTQDAIWELMYFGHARE